MNLNSNIVASFSLVFFLGFSLNSSAASEMETFYNNSKNKSVFEKAKKAGQIQKGKDAMIAACDKTKAKNPKANCDCVKRVINDTSDEEFFYESMLTIKIYKETMKAMKAGDEDRVKSLQAEQAKREGFPKILTTTCGMG